MKRIVDGITCMTQEPYVRTPKPEYMHMAPSAVAIAATKCTDNMDSAQSSYYKLSLLLRSICVIHVCTITYNKCFLIPCMHAAVATTPLNIGERHFHTPQAQDYLKKRHERRWMQKIDDDMKMWISLNC
ncbi:hypothetical protein Tco_0190808 [Tanacetum coccineum]